MISKAAWVPVGVRGLESAAEAAVRSETSSLIAAGPGAGKTELLAQRACYLLQTHSCPPPRRILAISFKRDAAANLRVRVTERCGRELSSRFDSMTFDAFSKSLIDRFSDGLPTAFHPSADYKILDRHLTDRSIRTYVESIPSSESKLTTARIAALNQRILWNAFNNRSIPTLGQWPCSSDEELAASALWTNLISSGGVSTLTFPMIGRMAEYLLRINPCIATALRESYPYVFLDEFQDTTDTQYALTRTAFMGSFSILTAVGDTKQRIMGWAGAKEQAFEEYLTDFSAKPFALKRNYRSLKSLVQVQTIVAQSLDDAAVAAQSMDDGTSVGECRAIAFRSEDEEASALAKLISKWVNQDRIPPRDICILCRMKEGEYTHKLQSALSAAGIRSRAEKDYQDLLAEPLCEFLLDVIKLAWSSPAPESWERVATTLIDIRGDLSERGMLKASSDLSDLTATFATQSEHARTIDDITATIDFIMAFAGIAGFKALYPQYEQGDWYEKTVATTVMRLSEARVHCDWPQTVAEIEGRDCVPIMTTHKSKGLEYHTVVFVGLEDGAYFSFARQSMEETCTFFVALSRAKRRVYFTFSAYRKADRDGRTSRNVLQPLYQLLADAGVDVENGSDL